MEEEGRKDKGAAVGDVTSEEDAGWDDFPVTPTDTTTVGSPSSPTYDHSSLSVSDVIGLQILSIHSGDPRTVDSRFETIAVGFFY